jgi:hypothetical protein
MSISADRFAGPPASAWPRLTRGRVGRAEIAALDDAVTVCVTWTPADAPGAAAVRELDHSILTAVWGDRLIRLEADVTASGPVGGLDLTVEELR